MVPGRDSDDLESETAGFFLPWCIDGRVDIKRGLLLACRADRSRLFANQSEVKPPFFDVIHPTMKDVALDSLGRVHFFHGVGNCGCLNFQLLRRIVAVGKALFSQVDLPQAIAIKKRV